MVSLLPAATPAERALEEAMRSGIDFSKVGTLWNPATCPPEVLPFLAWGLAISHWDSDWSVERKRQEVAGAVAFHKIKGTRAAVEQVLNRFHPLLTIVESWERSPRGKPHTFEVRAPANEIPANFLTAETSEAIIRDVAAAKSLRAHFDFVQVLEAQARLFMAAGGLAGSMHRADYVASHDTGGDWGALLLTDLGEPIRTDDGASHVEMD